jgi:hypothetical protein
MGRAVRRVVLAGLAAGAVMLCGGGLSRAQTAAVERTADGGSAMVVHATSGRDYFASSFLDAGGLPSRFAWRVGFRLGPQLLPMQAGEGCTISVTMFEFECALPDGAAPRPPLLYAEQGDDGVDLHLAGGPVVLYAGPGDDTVRTAGPGRQSGGQPVAGVRSEIYAGTGDDSVGQFGSDPWQLYGLPGSCRSGPQAPAGAVLYGGPGSDRVCDTVGEDRLVVTDGEIDLAACADGRDVVVADRVDAVLGECERVERASPPRRQAAAAYETLVWEQEAYDRHILAVAVGCQADGPAFCPVRLRLTWPGRNRQFGPVREFGVARGYAARLLFRFLEDTLDRLARTGVRATTFTELRSGRVVRTSRLLRVPRLPEGD